MTSLKNITKEELEIIIKNSHTYRDVLKSLGYNSLTGNNNKTLKNKIEKYDIDISHFNQNYYNHGNKIKFTDEEIFNNTI